MLDKFTLETKRALYLNQIQELKDKDIQAEVDNRLASERARLEAEVKQEIEADIKKCENYLELLATLIDEAKEEEIEQGEQHEEIKETFDEEVPIETHSTNVTAAPEVDIFQMR